MLIQDSCDTPLSDDDRARIRDLRRTRAHLMAEREELLEKLEEKGVWLSIGETPLSREPGQSRVEFEEDKNHYLEQFIEQLQDELEAIADCEFVPGDGEEKSE